IKLTALQPFTSSNLSIPVTVLQSAPRNTLVTINLHITGDNTCDKGGVDAALTIRTGGDDVPTSSATDHAETKLTVWAATGAGAGTLWGKALDGTGNQLFLGQNAGFISDTQFVSPPLNARTDLPVVVDLVHAFSLEGSPAAFFDGGVIELSTDGGMTWQDVSAFGVTPGYTGTLALGGGNPLEGRSAFTGTSTGSPALKPLELDFGMQLAGMTFQLRFRIGTDVNTSFTGWLIDDITIHGLSNTPFP